MSTYSDKSINTIIVPNMSGVLSDEQYKMLSPNSYMLDHAISEYNSIQGKIKKAIESFSNDYESLSEKIEEDLGTDFFSINNKPLGIVNIEEIIKVEQQITGGIMGQLESVEKSMNTINSKLMEVEASLVKMNENYHKRKNEIEEEQDKYNRYLQSEPQQSNYNNDDDFTQAYSTWNQQLNSILQIINDLESKLKVDCVNTKNSISVSWYCEEKR